MNRKIKQCHYRRLCRTRQKVKKVAKDRYRLSIFKSNCNLYAQIIDDSRSFTVLGVSTLGADFKNDNKKNKTSIKYAEKLGKSLYEKYKEKNIDKDLFVDRGLYKYCGVIQSFVESLRSCGMNF